MGPSKRHGAAIPSRRSAAMKVMVFQRPNGALPFNPAATWSPSSKRRHVGLGPGLIDKDQALGIDVSLILPPLLAPALDVFAILFLCGGGFFYGSALRRAGTPRPSGGRPSARERYGGAEAEDEKARQARGAKLERILKAVRAMFPRPEDVRAPAQELLAKAAWSGAAPRRPKGAPSGLERNIPGRQRLSRS